MYATWSFLIAVAFLPGIVGAGTSPRWAVVALSLYWLPPLTLPFVAYGFWLLDFDQACHWAFIAGALGFGMRADRNTIEAVVLVFCMGLALSSLIMPFQLAGWQGIPQAGPGGGLFVNKNLAGEAAVLGLLAAMEFFPFRSKRYAACAASTLPAIVLSGSRGALAALLCVTVSKLPWRWSLALCLAALLCGFILFFLGSNLLSATSLIQRASLWSDAVRHLSWIGNGSYDYSTIEHREPYLHNDWLQFIYEFGLVGVAPLVLAVVVRSRAPVFVLGFTIVASFEFPLHMPATAWLAAVIAGYCLRRTDNGGRIGICSRPDSKELRVIGQGA